MQEPSSVEDGMDKRVDLAVAAAFLLFGCWLLRASTTIPPGSVDDAVGSGGFGRVLAILVMVLSGYLVVRRLSSWRRYPGSLVPTEGSSDDQVAPASTARAFGVLAALAAYVLAIQYAGYLVGTPPFLLVGLWLMQVRSPVKLAAIALGYTIGSYALFVGVFGVLLPLGVMDRWDYILWFHF